MSKVTRDQVLEKIDNLSETLQRYKKDTKRSVREHAKTITSKKNIDNPEYCKESTCRLIENISNELDALVDSVKDIKRMTKKISKRPRRPRQYTYGIFKKVKLSDELIKFTGWDYDKKYSRVEVYKFIYNYVRDNELNQTLEKKNVIEPDFKLAHLLSYDEDEDGLLKFYHIQKYLKREKHFLDDDKTEGADDTISEVASTVATSVYQPGYETETEYRRYKNDDVLNKYYYDTEAETEVDTEVE